MPGVDQVAVVITAYRAERSIARAIRSALSQHEVSQVVVVDDASDDGTSAAANGADDGSGRLTLIRLPVNRGPSAARNVAFAAATAPLLSILDADDVLLPGRFAALDDGGDWDLLADNIAFVPEGAGVPPRDALGAGRRQRALSIDEFVDRNIPRPGRPRAELGFLKPVIRRAMLDRLDVRYDESLRLGEDFILYLTAMLRGARFALSEHPGYVAEVRAGSLSGRHATADLAALADADRRLIAASRHTATPQQQRLLRRHLRSLEQKVATRRLLDRKREVGPLRALAGAAVSPLRLVRSLGELARARGTSPAPPPPLRLLMQADEFDPAPTS